MTKVWKYGNSWENYPCRSGEVWIEQETNSKLAVWDLFDGLPAFMLEADLIYTDPPWNTGNMRSFYTKAGLSTDDTFREFLEVLFDAVEEINAPVCYLEIGKQNIDVFANCLGLIYPVVERWEVTYYRKNPSWLVRGGESPATFDFTGHDDMDTPRLAMENEWFSCVADLCMGRGLTAVTAFEMGQQFVGTELHPRRLACTIDKVAKKGGAWHTTRL